MAATGLYLFLGPDRAGKQERLQSLSQSLQAGPLDRHRLEAAGLTASVLLSICRQRPASASARLVIVDEAHKLGADAVEALAAHAEVIAKTACVVLITEADLAAKHPLQAAIRAFTTEAFAGLPGAPIKPFAMAEAIGKRDTAGALAALHEQLSVGREPVEIIGMIGWQLQRWVTLRRLMDAKMAPARIAQQLGMRGDWQLGRVQSEIAGRPLAALQKALERCCQTDAELKSGRNLPVLALEKLVIELCGAGKSVSSSTRSGSAAARAAT